MLNELLEKIAKLLKLKVCANCRFYSFENCCYGRTCSGRGFYENCYHFSLVGYHDRYIEFLTKVIEHYRKYGLEKTESFIDRVSIKHKYNIKKFNIYEYEDYVRLWFIMEEDNHYCHFRENWYETDLKVRLSI